MIGKRLQKDGCIIVELKSAKEVLMLGTIATTIRRSPYYYSSIAYEFVPPTWQLCKRKQKPVFDGIPFLAYLLCSVQRDSNWLSLSSEHAWRQWRVLWSSFKNIKNYKYICYCKFDEVFYVVRALELHAWVCTRSSRLQFFDTKVIVQ